MLKKIIKHKNSVIVQWGSLKGSATRAFTLQNERLEI